MDYIHGSVAMELRRQNECALSLFGTVEQDRHFREQLARIQAITSSFTFAEIGGLYYNEDTNDFYIGPELQTGLGPWKTSTAYYDDLTLHLMKSVSDEALRKSPSFMLPTILSFLLRTHGEEKNGPFRLINRDFGAHNILVNENFDIVGLLDFDGIMAAPLEAMAQYPLHCSMDRDPPGYVSTFPAVMERIAHNLPFLHLYKEILTKIERDEGTTLQLADRLGSLSASAYQGLQAYGQHQDFVNESWMNSCLKMLQN